MSAPIVIRFSRKGINVFASDEKEDPDKHALVLKALMEGCVTLHKTHDQELARAAAQRVCEQAGYLVEVQRQ